MCGVFLSSLAGCGGGEEEPKEDKADTAATTQPQPKPKVDPPKENKPTTEPIVDKGDDKKPEEPAKPAVPVKPPRSSDYAAWSDNDYREAVRERDQAVVGAIKWLSQNKKEDHSAELLAELLALAMQPPAEPPPKPSTNNNPAGGLAGNNGRSAPSSAGTGSGGRPAPSSAGTGGARPAPSSAGTGAGSRPAPSSAGTGAGGAQTPPQSMLDDELLKFATIAALTGDYQSLLQSMIVQRRPFPGGSGQGSRPTSGYGSLNMQEFVTTAIDSFFVIDTPAAWTNLGKLLDGSLSTPLNAADVSAMLREKLLLNYAGAAHPSHKLLLGLINKQTPHTDAALEMYTAYAASSVNQLMGLQAAGNGQQQRPGPGLRPGPGAAGAGGRRAPTGAGTGGGARPTPGSAGTGGGDAATGGGASPSASAPALDGGASAGAGAQAGGSSPSASAPALDGGGGGGAAAPGGASPSASAPGLGTGGAGARPAVGANNTGPSLNMTSGNRSMSPDQLKRVTDFLWHDEFSQAVTGKLSGTGSFGGAPQLLALAGSLPTPKVRQARFDLLKANHGTGPAALEQSDYFTSIARDPGRLVVMKSLTGRRASGSAQSKWDEAVKKTVLAMNRDLHQAAIRSPGVLPQPSPVPLHKGAEPLTVFQTSWPQDINGRIGTSKPAATTITYIRMEEDEARKFKSIASHYQRRIGANKKIPDKDNDRQIVWYTSLRGGGVKNGGLKKSIDVVFSPGGRTAGSGSNRTPGAPSFGGTSGGGGAAGATSAIIEILVIQAPGVVTADGA